MRYYREEGRADELVIELPKGGYAPVFKTARDAGPREAIDRRALVSRNTVAVLPFADHSGDEATSSTSARRARGNRPQLWPRSPSLRVLASRASPRATGDRTDAGQAALISAAACARSGDASASTRS